METKLDKTGLLKPVMEAANDAEMALRAFRSDLDRIAYQFPDGERKELTGAADEATNLLKRVFRIQETVRAVALAK